MTGRRARADHLTSPSHCPNNRLTREVREFFAHSRTNAGADMAPMSKRLFSSAATWAKNASPGCPPGITR